MRGAVVALEGPSGVGKSTVGRRLATRLGAAYLSEAWERIHPRPSLRYRDRAGLLRLERRLLAEESLRFRLARRIAATGRPVIADTGFLGPVAYATGLATLDPRLDVVRPLAEDAVQLVAAGRLGMPDETFYLDAPPAVLGERQQGHRPERPGDLSRRHWRVAEVERSLWTGAGRARRVAAVGAPENLAATVRRLRRPWTVDPIPRGVTDLNAGRALELVAAALAGVPGNR